MAVLFKRRRVHNLPTQSSLPSLFAHTHQVHIVFAAPSPSGLSKAKRERANPVRKSPAFGLICMFLYPFHSHMLLIAQTLSFPVFSP